MSAPEEMWAKVAQTLRVELGDGPFGSYIAPSGVRQGRTGELNLVTPTAYARDWIRRNALRRINELWSGQDALRRRLDAKSRAEFEAENPGVSTSFAVPAAASVQAVPADGGLVTPTVAPVADGPRAVRAAGLQDKLTFDTFVGGQGNEFALAVARQVASWADGHFNPIFFCGPYGYGKTHLLNAIAWEAQRLRPDAKVVYLTAERFLSTFVKA
ncbi:MAG TPA: DnaA/Hda family protein, partial [Caulobacteraceae bacterium]